MMIDTHSHLYADEFAADIDDVLSRARAAGVGKIFLPCCNSRDLPRLLALCQQHPGYLYPMIGLHPEDISDDWPEVLKVMEQQLEAPDNPYIAIGEVGLDYYWDRSRYDEQQEVFAHQVEWACRYGLPLMIHARSAHRELVDVLRRQEQTMSHADVTKPKSQTLTGVFHCFSGTEDEAAELLTFDGFMLGIGGVVTFKKSSLPDVLRRVVPLERIVVETDAPYLAPVPHRGKRNESAFVEAVVQRISEIYDVSVAEVTRMSTQNALHIFPKVR